MLERFRRREQFDCEKILGKSDNRPQFERARHPHGNVVLLSARRRDIIDTRRMSEHASFVDQRCCRDLRDHET